MSGVIHLKGGAHDSRSKGMCAMEAAAYIAGERHSDAPECVSPVISTLLRAWNDNLPSDADRDRLLKPLLSLVLFTRTTAQDEETRAWMATDWLVRVHAPAWLDRAGLGEHATKLRNLPTLTPSEITLAVQQTRAAARDAAWAAAGDAAWAAAGDAARDAAWAAAGDAARDAAWAAARDAIAPTVTMLQASAQDLVRRMAEVGTPREREINQDRLCRVMVQ
jgi:hypothetical protein